MKEFNLKAIFFIPTRFIDSKDLIWDYNLFLNLLKYNKELNFKIDGKINTFSKKENDYSSYLKRFIIYLKIKNFKDLKKF